MQLDGFFFFFFFCFYYFITIHCVCVCITKRRRSDGSDKSAVRGAVGVVVVAGGGQFFTEVEQIVQVSFVCVCVCVCVCVWVIWKSIFVLLVITMLGWFLVYGNFFFYGPPLSVGINHYCCSRSPFLWKSFKVCNNNDNTGEEHFCQ